MPIPESYATRPTLSSQLRALGLAAGDVVLMHSSMRSLGWVVGGAETVIEALLDVLGPDGTLAVPTHTSDNSDPAEWSRPPVPAAWWGTIRETMPGFDRARTPASPAMGRLAELVRTWPGAVRSGHPQVSFAAVGAHADEIVAGHRLDDALGESSPLGAIYRLGGSVLLLGCGHGNNTSIHLAEWRDPGSPRKHYGSRVLTPDGSAWLEWDDVEFDADDFAAIGADFERETGGAAIGPVGDATARLMPQRAVVDYALGWMQANRRR